jgi:hypothetical protein
MAGTRSAFGFALAGHDDLVFGMGKTLTPPRIDANRL